MKKYKNVIITAIVIILVFLGTLIKCSNIKNTVMARMYTQKTACQDNVTR